jgi:hypothetical protein
MYVKLLYYFIAASAGVLIINLKNFLNVLFFLWRDFYGIQKDLRKF